MIYITFLIQITFLASNSDTQIRERYKKRYIYICAIYDLLMISSISSKLVCSRFIHGDQEEPSQDPSFSSSAGEYNATNKNPSFLQQLLILSRIVSVLIPADKHADASLHDVKLGLLFFGQVAALACELG